MHLGQSDSMQFLVGKEIQSDERAELQRAVSASEVFVCWDIKRPFFLRIDFVPQNSTI
jgi:hypothetical protein